MIQSKKNYILSLYFGYHDSSVTYSSRNSILLHLEAERYFRRKHMKVNAQQMMELIEVGLLHLGLDIDDFSTLYIARWNNKFPSRNITVLGKMFSPILTSHHENHIGCVYPSRFEKSLIVCADGGSEDGTTKFYLQDEKGIRLLADYDDEIITGKFYGTITQMIIHPHVGRAHDTYPGKTMGLAACGNYSHEFQQLLEEHWQEINRLHKGGVDRLLDVFGLSSDYEQPWLDQRRKDLAFTAQEFWQKAFWDRVSEYASLSDNVCLVGGCAMNVLLNSAIADAGVFKKVYVSPVSSDSGQSLGAILFHHPEIECKYPYLGRGFGEVAQVPEELLKDILAHRIVAWYQGRSEIGPRALGHRSFLGLPDSLKMKVKLSEEVKKRESYRPVAPILPEQYLEEFFRTEQLSPYMTFAPRVEDITARLAPAIVHSDGTSRIQTLAETDNPVLHDLLVAVKNETGVPILMNSSLNLRGEPIVDIPEDARATFWASKADVLYVNGKRYVK